MWITGKCPYLSTRGCKMAAQIAALPVETCPVTPDVCTACLAEWEPTPTAPNDTVGAIARRAVTEHQPSRLRQWSSRFSVPERESKPLAESDLPCIHRGEKVGEHVCTPCRGGRTHQVHQCTLKGRECTPLASDAVGKDGATVEFCITCQARQVRAREPEPRTARYIRTPDGKDASGWGGRFSGSVFLVCGGPGLNNLDLSLLNQRGIMVAAVNNVAASHVRPHLWFSADEPLKFHQAIFADPAIACFIRGNFGDRPTRRLADDKSIPGPKAREFPNVWTYDVTRIENPKPYDFLASECPLWPSAGTRRGIMLIALRMLIDLGFTTIYLAGCDFRMEKGLKSEESRGSYAFDEGKDERACQTNNSLFASVDAYLSNVNPILKGAGISVFNCSTPTHLTAFERMDFRDAVQAALKDFPQVESLFGYYWKPSA